jgi:hypothetical protein
MPWPSRRERKLRARAMLTRTSRGPPCRTRARAREDNVAHRRIAPTPVRAQELKAVAEQRLTRRCLGGENARGEFPGMDVKRLGNYRVGSRTRSPAGRSADPYHPLTAHCFPDLPAAGVARGGHARTSLVRLSRVQLSRVMRLPLVIKHDADRSPACVVPTLSTACPSRRTPEHCNEVSRFRVTCAHYCNRGARVTRTCPTSCP